MDSQSDLVSSHYNRNPENKRLYSNTGLLEYERTKLLIKKFLPSGKLDILDLGGATGVYSFWLAEMGHRLCLFDISEEHIRIAKAINAEKGSPLAEIVKGDARDLGFNRKFSVILNMGPMYHIQDTGQRQQVLRECMRVLRPNGVLFCAYISRFASLLDGYRSGYIEDAVYRDLVNNDLSSGRHNPPPDDKYFTQAYFHYPNEIQDELSGVGFSVQAVCAVEGPFWLFHDIGKYLADGDARVTLLKYLDRMSEDPTMIGASAHLLSVSLKKTDSGSLASDSTVL